MKSRQNIFLFKYVYSIFSRFSTFFSFPRHQRIAGGVQGKGENMAKQKKSKRAWVCVTSPSYQASRLKAKPTRWCLICQAMASKVPPEKHSLESTCVAMATPQPRRIPIPTQLSKNRKRKTLKTTVLDIVLLELDLLYHLLHIHKPV